MTRLNGEIVDEMDLWLCRTHGFFLCFLTGVANKVTPCGKQCHSPDEQLSDIIKSLRRLVMSETTNKATGHRMKMVQKTLGLSAGEMASAMGYTSKSNYYRICRGEARITEDRLYCLRDTYDVNLECALQHAF